MLLCGSLAQFIYACGWNVQTGSDYTHQVQRNLIEYHRLFADITGISFVDDDIVYLACKGLPGSIVLRTNFSDADISLRVEKALDRIGQVTNSIDWWVFPSCRPADLGEQLIQHAKALACDWQLVGDVAGPGGIWMLADLTSLSDAPSVSPDFRVERVGDAAQLKEWVAINAEGFGSDDYQVFSDAFARHGFGPDASALHYIGYLNDQPVSSATLFLAGEIASVFNVSTPEPLRRQGFGSAVTYAALQDAPKRGYRTAYLQSSGLGRGVYIGLGFTITDFGIREYVWQKR